MWEPRRRVGRSGLAPFVPSDHIADGVDLSGHARLFHPRSHLIAGLPKGGGEVEARKLTGLVGHRCQRFETVVERSAERRGNGRRHDIVSLMP